MSGIFNASIFNNSVFNTGVADTGVRPSGGIPATLSVRPRSRQQLEQDRKRFGIPPKVAAIIEAVAQRQADTLETDEQKRFEELERQLVLEKVKWDRKYLAYMNEMRQRLIDAEIAARIKAKMEEARLKAKLEEEELMIVMVLTAAVV